MFAKHWVELKLQASPRQLQEKVTLTLLSEYSESLPRRYIGICEDEMWNNVGLEIDMKSGH